jgi:hypothetical protein
MKIKYRMQTCQVDAGAVFALVATFTFFVTIAGCYKKRLIRLRDETVNPKLEIIYRETIQHRSKHVSIQPAGSRQIVEIPEKYKSKWCQCW